MIRTRGEESLVLPLSILLMLGMVLAGLVGVRATLENALDRPQTGRPPERGLSFDLSLPPEAVPSRSSSQVEADVTVEAFSPPRFLVASAPAVAVALVVEQSPQVPTLFETAGSYPGKARKPKWSKRAHRPAGSVSVSAHGPPGRAKEHKHPRSTHGRGAGLARAHRTT